MNTSILYFFSGLSILCLPIKTLAQEKIEPVHTVIVSDGIQLQVERKPEYSITVSTNESGNECLVKSIENGVLTLKLRSSSGCKGKVVVSLTCPGIKHIEVTAKAEVSSKNLFTGDSLTVVLRTSGKIYFDLDIKYLKADLFEGALFNATGYALVQDISVNSNAAYSCFKLEGDSVKVSALNQGKAKVCAAKYLDASAKSGGYISYKCQPERKSLLPQGNGRIEESLDE